MATIPEEFNKVYDYLIKTNEVMNKIWDQVKEVNQKVIELESLVKLLESKHD